MSVLTLLRSERARVARLAWGYRVLLIAALLFHLSLLVSWRVGFWNRFVFDATATHGWRGWDFYALYQAGHNVLTGISAYESDNDKIAVVVPYYTPYRYLPVMAYTLGVVVNAVTPLWAYRLWVAAVELTLLACAYGTWRSSEGSGRGVVAAALWLCFTPYYLELYLGQFSLVQAALIFLMLLAALRPPVGWRYDLAWIMSLLWKQNTGLFVPLFLRLKRWRALTLAAGAVLVTALPYFAFYPAALHAFLANFSAGTPSPQLGNLGVRQFLFSLVAWLFPALSSDAHSLLQILWVAVVLAIALWLTFRPPAPDLFLLLCLWTTSYFLVYHQVWEHHYVLLLPVYALLFQRTGSPWVLWLYLPVALWTPYILIDPQGLSAYHTPMYWTFLQPQGLDVLYHACKALPVLGLWVYLVRLVHRHPITSED